MSSPAPSRIATVSARTRAERVRLLFSISGGISAASLIFSGLVLARLWPLPNAFLLAAWAAMMFLFTTASAWVVDRYRASAPPPAHAGRWERRLGLVSALQGFGWGALNLVTLPPQDGAQHMFIMLVLGTINLGAGWALTPSRIAFYSFILPAGVTLALSLGLAGPAGFALGGWATMGLLIALVMLHDLFHRNLVAALAKRFESDALAQEQQIIFDTASEAITFIRDERIVKCNRRFAELLGSSLRELVGQPAKAWFPGEKAWQQVAQEAQPIIYKGGTYRSRIELRRRNGATFPCEISGTAVDPTRPELGTVWMGRDLTAQLQTEEALRASEERFRDLLALSTDWYWEQDRHFRFVRASGGAPERTGFPLDHVVGKRRWELEQIRGVSDEQWQAHRAQLARREPFRDFTYQMQLPGGETRWFSISGKPVFDETGAFAGYHGVGTDVTERVRSAEQFRHLAHHDMLTGLPNRRLLTDRMEQAIALARRAHSRVGLMLLDLDDFKVINDTEGHSVGDQVLVTVAQRLRSGVRESDTVARLGGDEFVILLQDPGQPRDISRIAAKVIEAVREPLMIGNSQYQLGVSIGIALFPDHADSAERLLQQADIAMYEAKRGGGSAVQVSHADSVGGPEQLSLIEPSPTRH